MRVFKNTVIFLLVILLIFPVVSVLHPKKENISRKEYSLMTYVAFGDSITYGIDGNFRYGDSGYKMSDSYPNLVGRSLGLYDVQNRGISGGSLCPHSGRTNMTQKILDFNGQADIITVMLGVNDYDCASSLGNKDSRDNTTIYGSLHMIAQHLTENYPGALIIFMTPFPRRGGESDNSKGYNMLDVRQAVIDVAYKFNIPVLDMYKKGKYQTEMNVSPNDGLHPSQGHHKTYTAPLLSSFIEQCYLSEKNE